MKFSINVIPLIISFTNHNFAFIHTKGPWPIRSLLFSEDGVTGFATGGNFFSGVGGMYVTTDGGHTWKVDQTTGVEQTVVRSIRDGSGHIVDPVSVGCARGGGKIFKRVVSQ